MTVSKHTTSEICEITLAYLGGRAAEVNVPKSDDYYWNATNKNLFRELVTSKMWDINITALVIMVRIVYYLNNFLIWTHKELRVE